MHVGGGGGMLRSGDTLSWVEGQPLHSHASVHFVDLLLCSFFVSRCLCSRIWSSLRFPHGTSLLLPTSCPPSCSFFFQVSEAPVRGKLNASKLSRGHKSSNLLQHLPNGPQAKPSPLPSQKDCRHCAGAPAHIVAQCRYHQQPGDAEQVWLRLAVRICVCARLCSILVIRGPKGPINLPDIVRSTRP